MEGGMDREMDNKRLEDCEIKIYYFDHNIWGEFPLNNRPAIHTAVFAD